jgi:hypothetical protein
MSLPDSQDTCKPSIDLNWIFRKMQQLTDIPFKYLFCALIEYTHINVFLACITDSFAVMTCS